MTIYHTKRMMSRKRGIQRSCIIIPCEFQLWLRVYLKSIRVYTNALVVQKYIISRFVAIGPTVSLSTSLTKFESYWTELHLIFTNEVLVLLSLKGYDDSQRLFVNFPTEKLLAKVAMYFLHNLVHNTGLLVFTLCKKAMFFL